VIAPRFAVELCLLVKNKKIIKKKKKKRKGKGRILENGGLITCTRLKGSLDLKGGEKWDLTRLF
jgi:hypothetical protein